MECSHHAGYHKTALHVQVHLLKSLYKVHHVHNLWHQRRGCSMQRAGTSLQTPTGQNSIHIGGEMLTVSLVPSSSFLAESLLSGRF